jgi:hypothetical protein
MLTRVLALLRRAGFDYSCFRIYSVGLGRTSAGPAGSLPAGYRIAEVSAADLESSPHPEIRACRDYLGADACVYGVFRSDGVLACVQCFWFGDRFARVGFWPLTVADAASMHLFCIASERGRRLATCLKRETAERMRERGFLRLYSRIWWSNTASRRVSERVGWTHVGTVLEVKLPALRRPLRFVRQHRRDFAQARAGAPVTGSRTLR